MGISEGEDGMAGTKAPKGEKPRRAEEAGRSGERGCGHGCAPGGFLWYLLVLRHGPESLRGWRDSGLSPLVSQDSIKASYAGEVSTRFRVHKLPRQVTATGPRGLPHQAF